MNGIRSRRESRPQPGQTQFVPLIAQQEDDVIRQVAVRLADGLIGGPAAGSSWNAAEPVVLRSCSVCHTLFEVPAGTPVEPGERYCSKACRRIGHRRRTA